VTPAGRKAQILEKFAASIGEAATRGAVRGGLYGVGSGSVVGGVGGGLLARQYGYGALRQALGIGAGAGLLSGALTGAASAANRTARSNRIRRELATAGLGVGATGLVVAGVHHRSKK
jgi:hypothetical protein